MTTYAIHRGESKTFEHTVTSTAGDLVDLTDAEITFVVRGLDGEIVLTLKSVRAGGSTDEIEILDQAADSGADLGKFRVKVETLLAQTAYWADCWVIAAADPPETLIVVDHAPFYVTGEAIPA